MTPLYRFLKEKGTTFYAFASAAEDISSAYQNDNFSMDFSKFVLLNIPKQNLTSGDRITFDFENSFEDNQPSGSLPADFSEQIIESLRNYVTNHEVTTKETRLSNNEYFYNNNKVSTITEKVFWKWCRKLNIIDFEPAIPQDEYFDNLEEFQSNDENDDEFFNEILWKEREVTEWRFLEARQGSSFNTTFTQPLEVEFNGATNLRIGDIVEFNNVTNSNLTFLNGQRLEVIDVTPPSLTVGQIIKLGLNVTLSTELEQDGTVELVYDTLVKYIGEINSVNNTADANRSYTEVVAHIGDHQGRTPDILFRTTFDDNYRPGLQYPLLPSQFQPEIVGSENFSSPIRNNPQDYPGSYFGQFDNANFTYSNSNGDSLRRSGDYFGVKGDVNNIVIEPENLDGITIDFNREHYAKMNIINREVDNFDEFNALDVNNEPPKDFEFNAVLWYYTVTDINGNSSTNLYGIEFLNHPINNENPNLVGLKIPTLKKLVNDGIKDGTSYSFSLNLNFNILNDNVQPLFNPQNVNTLFSFDLFNDAMRRLGSANDSFRRALDEHEEIKTQLNNLRQLIYTTTDIEVINRKINNLEKLLKLYETMQLVSTDTIEVVTNFSSTPPLIELNSTDSVYFKIENVNVTDLYSLTTGIIPYNLSVPNSKDFLLRVVNDDTISDELPGADDSNLTIIIDRDLDFKQTLTVDISSIDDAFVNRKLDIYLNYNDGTPNAISIETPLIENIDLPIFFNEETQDVNTARKWENTDFKVDVNNGSYSINFESENILEMPLESTLGFEEGDAVVLNNFYIGSTISTNYSGQYIIDEILPNNIVRLNVESNSDLIDFIDSQTSPFPINVHNQIQSILNSQPFINLNKGLEIKITRVSSDDSSSLSNRYNVTINRK